MPWRAPSFSLTCRAAGIPAKGLLWGLNKCPYAPRLCSDHSSLLSPLSNGETQLSRLALNPFREACCAGERQPTRAMVGHRGFRRAQPVAHRTEAPGLNPDGRDQLLQSLQAVDNVILGRAKRCWTISPAALDSKRASNTHHANDAQSDGQLFLVSTTAYRRAATEPEVATDATAVVRQRG